MTVHLRAAAFTHQGAVRAHNEDTIAVADWITSEPMAQPLVLEHAVAAPLICLVADGMGGHAAGEVASRSVAEHLCRRAAGPSTRPALAALLRAADAELFALMQEQPAWRGMGTTVAGLSVAPERVIGVQRRRQPGLPDRGRRARPAEHRRHPGTEARRRPHRGADEQSDHPDAGRRAPPRRDRAAPGERAPRGRRPLPDLQRRPDRSVGPADPRGAARPDDEAAPRRCSRPPWRAAAPTTSR